MKKTQTQIVLDRINEVGYVDNFWAIQNYILRLGGIIYKLRKDGMNFSGAFGKELGKERAYWKNYYYTYVNLTPTSFIPASEISEGKVVSSEMKQPTLL